MTKPTKGPWKLDFDNPEDYDQEGPNGEPSRATLANDGRLAKHVLVIRFSSGHVITQNSRGRCEDAPCCGCCT